MRQLRGFLHKDDGITLLEVIAVLVVMMMLMPAIYTSYATAARSSEITLQRLRCLGIARQELETRKSDGFEELGDVIDSRPQPMSQSNFGESGINLETNLERITISDPGGSSSLPAIRVRVKAANSVAEVVLYAIVVSGGY